MKAELIADFYLSVYHAHRKIKAEAKLSRIISEIRDSNEFNSLETQEKINKIKTELVSDLKLIDYQNHIIFVLRDITLSGAFLYFGKSLAEKIETCFTDYGRSESALRSNISILRDKYKESLSKTVDYITSISDIGISRIQEKDESTKIFIEFPYDPSSVSTSKLIKDIVNFENEIQDLHEITSKTRPDIIFESISSSKLLIWSKFKLEHAYFVTMIITSAINTAGLIMNYQSAEARVRQLVSDGIEDRIDEIRKKAAIENLKNSLGAKDIKLDDREKKIAEKLVIDLSKRIETGFRFYTVNSGYELQFDEQIDVVERADNDLVQHSLKVNRLPDLQEMYLKLPPIESQILIEENRED
jgi:hypothetical protein